MGKGHWCSSASSNVHTYVDHNNAAGVYGMELVAYNSEWFAGDEE